MDAFTMLFLGGDVPQTGQNRWTGRFSFAYDLAAHDYPWFKVDTKTQHVEPDPYWSEMYRAYDFSALNMEAPPA